MAVEVTPLHRSERVTLDPSGQAMSSIERNEVAMTIAALPRSRYRRTFEPGCAAGDLTRRLSSVSDAIVAMDVSADAVAAARRRCAERPDASCDVQFVCGEIPDVWPSGSFDLAVMSGLGCYWDAEALAPIVVRMFAALDPGGELVAVHWLGASADRRLHGVEVHRIIGDVAHRRHAAHLVSLRDGLDGNGFLLDVWRN